MTPDLLDRILTHLDVTGASNEPWALAIVAALDGEAQLTAFLDKKTSIAMPEGRSPQTAAARVEPPGVYLSSLTVEGFRGVGPAATLSLTPGPGLSLIVGRNGSGKSSFAEGLEFLLTGSNYRWEGRPKAWGDGWRNLHHTAKVALKADLLVEGQGALALTRAWAQDDLDDVDAGVAVAKRAGGKAQTLESLGWDEALETFRPFLSYNELGSLLDEGPSKLYDALSSVLGLEELTAISTLLVAARKQRTDLTVVAKKRADEIRDALSTASSGSSDRRLADAVKALKGPAWDVAALAALVSGRESDAGMSELDLLTRVAAIPVPDEQAISASVSRLRSTHDALAAFAGTNTERSRERARLLDQALQFHAKHKGKDCPVCGTADAISSDWATATRREIDALKTETAACESAEANSRDAIREAQRFLTLPPPALAQAKDKGLSRLHDVRRLWLQWSEGRELDSATRLADHLESQVMELADAVRALIDEADTERTQREDIWRPAAVAIAGWLPDARAALAAKTQIEELKAAEKWWKDSSAAIRDERFAPIASRAMAIWSELRLQSNVEIGGIELEGNEKRRRVALQVTVDGSPAEALGVMSQGELHSLALSLFLPRATLAESPFRFIAIDDPVQSMDPARVEGLARVLADAARTRQVIVFTHDDRLPEAVRRLGIPATVQSVTRRARSVVDVVPTLNPVASLLDDARAVANTEDLPGAIAPRVVPGFCRMALEAACMEAIRRRRLQKGESHDSVEALLGANGRAHPLMALALCDDESKTGEVAARLKRFGPLAVETFERCKKGTHEGFDGDLKAFIRETEQLAKQIAQLR